MSLSYECHTRYVYQEKKKRMNHRISINTDQFHQHEVNTENTRGMQDKSRCDLRKCSILPMPMSKSDACKRSYTEFLTGNLGICVSHTIDNTRSSASNMNILRSAFILISMERTTGVQILGKVRSPSPWLCHRATHERVKQRWILKRISSEKIGSHSKCASSCIVCRRSIDSRAFMAYSWFLVLRGNSNKVDRFLY